MFHGGLVDGSTTENSSYTWKIGNLSGNITLLSIIVQFIEIDYFMCDILVF
jgi:hypothetical protein